MLFYTSCVTSVTEYSIPAFYNALPLYLKNELLRIEKRSISIITAGDCTVAHDLGIQPILEHYEFLCQKLFKGILDNPSHKLKALLPPIHKPSYNFKNKRHFNMPHLRTSRRMNTFIFAMARKSNGWIFIDIISLLLLLRRMIITIIIMIMMILFNQFLINL